jgi:ABC-type multidrug transport system ATPase subunit
VIDAENLTRKFSDLTAVEDLTLHVDKGEVFGFLGPNGAGKTTTVRMLCCLISKTNGKARIGDYEIGNSADVQYIRRIIGLLPENVGLYENLSAYLVIALLNTGTAMAIMTTPKTINTASSVVICGIPAPRTITFLKASAA